MMRLTIGIDNGASGSVGLIRSDGATGFVLTPTLQSLTYGKQGGFMTRLNRAELRETIKGYLTPQTSVRVYVERPFTGKFYKAVVSGMRFHEALVCLCEDMNWPLTTVDSREWQKAILGNVAAKQTKVASRLRGIERFPQFTGLIRKQGDADGLLIAQHYHEIQKA